MIVLLQILVIAGLVIRFVARRRDEPAMNIDSIFISFQALMTVGGLALLNWDDGLDREYAWLLSVPYFLYLFFSMLFSLRSGRSTVSDEQLQRYRGIEVKATRLPLIVPFLFIASALITIAYYNAVGYNLFVQQLIAVAAGGGGSEDVAGDRLAAYAGSEYLFPGYVNQFKNVLLPATALVIGHWAFAVRLRGRVALAVTMVLVCVLGLLGTGQRGALVLALVWSGLYFYLWKPRVAIRWSVVFVPVGIVLFTVSTLLLGRSSDELARQEGALAKFSILIGEVITRALGANQESALFAYYYVRGMPVQGGGEWVSSILGVLPGHAGSDLSNRVFETMYGSLRGTAPPSLWVSIYHNFGTIGVIAAPFVIALFCRAVINWISSKGVIVPLQLVGYSGFSAVFGAWVAGGPEYLLNAGAVAAALLVFLGRSVYANEKTQRRGH